MATIAQDPPRVRVGDTRFFLVMAFVMAAIDVAGFSLNLAAGRSSFAVPIIFHVHAFVFFGWIALYLAQNLLADTGSMALHRRLGWVALLWMPLMVVLGTVMTVLSVQRGAPFFFDVREFLFSNPLQLLLFGGLVGAALTMRRQTGWHRRLMYCGMAILTGPGLGRLLPMPLFMPHAWWATVVAVLILPLIGAFADWRRAGRVHPAWLWGIGMLLGMQLASDTIAFSPVGTAIARSVTAGTAGGHRPITPAFP
ncbi:hypothetical protein [Sphingomonas sp. TDK1]|uniref:hypothetical protein n=1 Tax=Sphingomonas sp. TDK1 TaxID=453247 RepID=UPI0007D991E2|nr:hypothetical protein [Sphingomonas sp. TDK1]OAN58836.1 hypothetical protein A7X12_04095 [Sphingomonas sp. TDK1]